MDNTTLTSSNMREQPPRNGHALNSAQTSTTNLSIAYEDPSMSASYALWLHTGVNELVKNALEKMEKAFAYNSVFFLKMVLDLQVQYTVLEPPPPPAVILDLRYALKISEILSARLARKEKVEGCSLSRELQLRTLVSALCYLSQHQEFILDNDTYANLLKYVSERDYDNYVKFGSEGKVGPLGSGDCDFLVRFACDIVRCMPNDFEPIRMAGFGQQAVHFMLAAGLVNQVRGGATLAYMEELFARLSAAHSQWHWEIRNLFDNVSLMIHLRYRSLVKGKSRDTELNSENGPKSLISTITERVIQELCALGPEVGFDIPDNIGAETRPPLPLREGQLLIYGLLDLLSQLVTTFATCDGVCAPAERLALDIITKSGVKEFRFKAFDIIIASRAGCNEEQYYDAMRNLEKYVVSLASTENDIDPDTKTEKSSAQHRTAQLKKEKRAAMDRHERKMILYRGAVESLHRRLQNKGQNAVRSTNTSQQSLVMSPSLERLPKAKRTESPAPNGSVLSQNICESPVSLGLPAGSDLFVEASATSVFPVAMDNSSQLHHGQPDPEVSNQGDLEAIDEVVKNRPLSFQRNVSEILEVSPRRKWTQLPPVEDETIAPIGEGYPARTIQPFEQSALAGNHKEGSPTEDMLLDTAQLAAFRPAKRIGQTDIARRANTEPDLGYGDSLTASNQVLVNAEGEILPWVQTHLASNNPSQEEIESVLIKDVEPQGSAVSELDMKVTQPGGAAHGVLASETGSLRAGAKGKLDVPDNPNSVQITESEYAAIPNIVGTVQTDGHDMVVKSAGEIRPSSVAEDSTMPSSQSVQSEVSQEHIIGYKQSTGNQQASSSDDRMKQNDQILNAINTKNPINSPLEGVNLQYSLAVKALSRLSAQSPIPVDSELPTLASTINEGINNGNMQDNSNSWEGIENLPSEAYDETQTERGNSLLTQKKPSRTTRLLASLPGSGIRRLGSVRTTPIDRAKQLSIIAADAPEVVPEIQPLVVRRSQTGPLLNEKMELLRRHTNAANNPPTSRSQISAPSHPVSDVDGSNQPGNIRVVNYDSIASEQNYKVAPKDNNLSLITPDCRHVIFVATTSFQVFKVPGPLDSPTGKPIHSYRLGEAEGIKKGKVNWEYKSAAASSRYIATITKERVQIHDLQSACKPIFTKEDKKHEYYSIAIAADKMVLSMAPINGATGAGVITIFHLNVSKHRWEEWKIIHLLIPVSGGSDPHGAPNLLSLTSNGKCLTACTKSGYYFAWDIVVQDDPILIGSGRVVPFDGIGSEILTGAFLFPDTHHLLCSTTSSHTEAVKGGCFIEPTRVASSHKPPHHIIRQIGTKISYSAISPNGNAVAFLGRSGQISIIPIFRIEGDENVTSAGAAIAQQKLSASMKPEGAGRLMFTPDGENLVAMDRKGKIVVLGFKRV